MEGLHAGDAKYSEDDTCGVQDGRHILCWAKESGDAWVFAESAVGWAWDASAAFVWDTERVVYG